MTSFSPKIDRISENIIYLLSLDSRKNVSQLAQRLSLPRKVVENRCKRLYHSNFIKPLLIVNHEQMVKSSVLIKQATFDPLLIKKIQQSSLLIKLKETLGMYDLSILLFARDQQEMNGMISKISKIFHKSTLSLDVIHHSFEDTLGYKSFCHEPTLYQKYSMLEQNKRPLTGEESKVISALSQKPNIKMNELIKSTNYGYNKLKNIISLLLKQRIMRFSVDPDYTKLGLEFHNILVKINIARSREFENNIMKHPRVHWIKKGIGRWDYILSVTARDVSEFIDITKEIRTQNNKSILDFSTLISKINVMRQY